MKIHFFSTRDKSLKKNFEEAVIEGLAEDGGLFLPAKLPDFSQKLEAFSKLSFQDLFYEIAAPFCENIQESSLREICRKSYENFTSEEIAPLRFLKKTSVLELFHGPTLAFKDFALQFLGNLFEYYLEKKITNLNIICATSGDTGSAAIHGVLNKPGINIFVLYPLGRVSEIQELQMIATGGKNVYPIAVKGTFDDCQSIVKSLLGDAEFKRKYSLGAVNSINFARILAQSVYYFYAYFKFIRRYPGKRPGFVVPTGNFGNVYSGLLAHKMGLPCERFVLAVNENDILARCLATGEYKPLEVKPTLSPSMDIQIASNFERFLFDVSNGDSASVKNKIAKLQTENRFVLSSEELKKTLEIFEGVRVEEKEVIETIHKIYLSESYLSDPHTAIGLKAAEKSGIEFPICLATAHPAKFADILHKIIPGADFTHPAFENLASRKKSRRITEADEEAVKKYITEKITAC